MGRILLCAALLVVAHAEPAEVLVDRSFWPTTMMYWRWMFNPNGEQPEKHVLPAKDRQPMKVIGAGFGRTGTSSMVQALHTLGYRSYHWMEGMIEHDHVALWARWIEAVHAGNKTAEKEAFDRVAEYMAKSGFNATMDYPTCLAFESFMEKYPDSKVILTVRTSGMAWANSIMNGVIDLTKGAQTKYAGLSQNLRDLRSIIFKQWQIMGLHVDVDTPIPVAEDLVPIYDKWLERVKNTVPADRLLIHQAKDGYEPLCKFLEIPPEKCPKEPYPKINSSDSLTKHKLALKAWMWFWFPVASIIFLGPFYCCYRCCCKGKKKTA